MSFQESNKALTVRLIEEGFNRGNLAVVDELVSADAKEYQRGNSNGSEGTKEVIKTLRGWFSDFNMYIDDIVAINDEVWVRSKASGTNSGSVMGRPPTGRKVKVDVIDIVRFKDGKIVEHWGVPDQLGLMIQLGFIPEPR
jgi:predicted ester cyclase